MDDVVIEAGRGFKNYWTDLWRYRELFYILAWRDISPLQTDGNRYRLGAHPTFPTMVVFTIVFNKIANFDSRFHTISFARFCRDVPVAVFFNRFK